MARGGWTDVRGDFIERPDPVPVGGQAKVKLMLFRA